MNRQRILLMVAGGVGALLLGRTVVGFYQNALSGANSQITGLQGKLAQLRVQKAESDVQIREWKQIGAQTLSMSPDETMQRLRDELYDMMGKSGLSKHTVELRTVQPYGKNGIRMLTCSISAEGTMQTVVQFLFQLYQRPYLVRVKNLTLAQVVAGRDAPRGQLKLTAGLETPILPPNAKVPRITPAQLEGNDEPAERTKFARLDDYQIILERGIVEPYIPPLPGKATNPAPVHDAANLETNVTLTWTGGAHTQRYQVFFGEGAPSQAVGTQETTQMVRAGLKPGTRYSWRVDAIGEGGTTTGDVWSFMTKAAPAATQIAQADPSPPPPPPPPPPADSAKWLARVLSSPRTQQAVLADALPPAVQPGQPVAVSNTPETRVEVGQPLFGGTLIYVHPRGVVSERDGALRFHAIGLQLQQARPLTQEEHPEIWHELRKLEAQASGINERPG